MDKNTPNYAQQAEELDDFLRTHLPLARAAGVKVERYTGDKLIASAPLDKNINDKGTAFGGSLYNICVIAAWGMTHLKSLEMGLKGDIVVAKGEINYLRPLTSQLMATAIAPTPELIARAKQGFVDRGKAIFSIKVEILDQENQPCVEFEGKYAVLAAS